MSEQPTTPTPAKITSAGKGPTSMRSEAGALGHALSNALSGHPYLSNVVVVESPDQLPAPVQAYLKDNGLDGRGLKGAYSQGQSYVITSNLQSLEDGVRTALHEVVGHDGVRALLGDRFKPVMLNLYRSFPRQHEAWITTGRRYSFLDSGSDAGRVAFAEELTAHLAETNAELSELNMVYAEIRAKLREQVPDLPITHLEVLALIQRTRESLTLRHGTPEDAAEIQRLQSERQQTSAAWTEKFIGEGGVSALDGSAPKEVRDDTNPSFNGWFQGSRVVDDSGAPLMVYHGTDSEDFDTFEMHRKTMRYTTFDRHEVLSQGASFSPDPDDAEQYGSNVKAYYLAIQRPFPDPGYQHTASQAHADVLEVLAPLIYESGEGEDAQRYIDVENGMQSMEVDDAGTWVEHFFVDGMIEWAPLDNPEVVSRLKSLGYDGAKVLENEDSAGYSWFVVNPAQIRPASDRDAPDLAMTPALDTTQNEGEPRLRLSESAFAEWFKQSKVTDLYNKPKVVYHGSPDIRGILEEGFAARPGAQGNVFFFSDDYHVANTYADDSRAFDYQNSEPYTLPCYLSMQNPYIVDGARQRWRETEHYIELARKAGHDGIIIRNSRDEYNTLDGGRPSTVYAVFDPTQIKSAGTGIIRSRIDGKVLGDLRNLGTYDPTNPDIRFSFAGESARTADTYALEKAQAQLLAGVDAERVRQQTGWFQGPDHKWRFEIDDSQAELTPSFSQSAASWEELEERYKQSHLIQPGQAIRLSDVIDHPRLYAAYPDLANIAVSSLEPQGLDDRSRTTRAAYSHGKEGQSPTILVDPQLPAEALISSILHEVQHAIQRMEGFAVGGSPGSARDSAEALNMQAMAKADKKLRELGTVMPELLTAYTQLEATRLTLYGEHGIDWKAPDAPKQLHCVMTPEQRERSNEARDAYNAAVLAHGGFDNPNVKALITAGSSRATAARQVTLSEGEAQLLYERLYGEVEARNVQTRQAFSAEDRQALAPEVTQDTPSDATVVVFNGTEMASSPAPALAPGIKAFHNALHRFDRNAPDSVSPGHLPKATLPDHTKGAIHEKQLGPAGITAHVAQMGARLKDLVIDLAEILEDYGVRPNCSEGQGSRVFIEALREWSGGKIQLGVISRDGSTPDHAVGILPMKGSAPEQGVILSGEGLTSSEAYLLLRQQAGHGAKQQLIVSPDEAGELLQQLPIHEDATSSMTSMLVLALGPYEDWESKLRNELNVDSLAHSGRPVTNNATPKEALPARAGPDHLEVIPNNMPALGH